MRHTCPTCGCVFLARPRRRYCSRECQPRVRPRIRPRRGALAQQLEKLAIKYAHEIAREAGKPIVDVFCGAEGRPARRRVYKRLWRNHRGVPVGAIAAAINATLVCT